VKAADKEGCGVFFRIKYYNFLGLKVSLLILP